MPQHPALTFNRTFFVRIAETVSTHFPPQKQFAVSLNSVRSRLHAALSFPLAKIGLVEVAIHTILYTRQVYPADLFVRRQKYDTPVFQSRHPALNEYISGAVKAIGEELASVHFSLSIIYFSRSTYRKAHSG